LSYFESIVAAEEVRGKKGEPCSLMCIDCSPFKKRQLAIKKHTFAHEICQINPIMSISPVVDGDGLPIIAPIPFSLWPGVSVGYTNIPLPIKFTLEFFLSHQ